MKYTSFAIVGTSKIKSSSGSFWTRESEGLSEIIDDFTSVEDLQRETGLFSGLYPSAVRRGGSTFTRKN